MTPEPLALRPVLNTLSEDIAPLLCAAAGAAGIDPVALLGLVKAESGLNPRAERWGTRTQEAKGAMEAGDLATLEEIIASEWPDIGYGYGQQIVAYHYLGNGAALLANCLAVRDGVFADPVGNLHNAAERLANGIRRSNDGTALGGMLVFNAGSDRRSDPAWMARWAGNVASYERALAWAEAYRA